ncbi:hypothetical protein RND71_039021 [Anisodus tanguticus]|uniref:Uncharacterized protein n=1 Tax=Anisodus tanguticus TaxID=243964 RepID=A0AAE1R0R0_9SOLA|nr:hypothetical protein RND71_039021 [Anisodus tanguticus]
MIVIPLTQNGLDGGVIDVIMTQVQYYAVPANLSDPYLREWVKPNNNPLIGPDTSINKAQFGHPTTVWIGQENFGRKFNKPNWAYNNVQK